MIKGQKKPKRLTAKQVYESDGTKTAAQHRALCWLHDRGGDGLFDKRGVLIAAGERATMVMKSTWNALEELGLVETYMAPGRRLRLTKRN